MKITQLSRGFVDYEDFGLRGQSFGNLDKGRELIFQLYQDETNEPIRVRFFISFLDRMANPHVSLDESKLFDEAKNILEDLAGTKIKTKDLLYLYNFSTQEFLLLEQDHGTDSI